MVAIGKKIQYGQDELLKETNKYNFNSILDIGFGNGYASNFFLKQGKKVTAIGFDIKYYCPDKELIKKIKIHENISAENMECFEDESFDAIWCSHLLEHCRNTELVLNETWRVLKPKGILFLIVPPFKHNIECGHPNIGWNVGLLMYNLILSKFDVKNGSFIKHKHNIVGYLRKQNIKLPELHFDQGDVEKLKDFFPKKHNYGGFNGNIINYNWEWKYYKKDFKTKLKEIKEFIVTLNLRDIINHIIKKGTVFFLPTISETFEILAGVSFIQPSISLLIA